MREWQESGQISPGRSSIAFRAEEPSTRVRTMPKTLQSTRAISNSTLRTIIVGELDGTDGLQVSIQAEQEDGQRGDAARSSPPP